MDHRRTINAKLTDWIRNRTETKYAGDVSMVLLYGSYINGTANSKSDVDCYFIPKTERGYQMAATFVIDGVGYDIFPMSWDRVAEIADLQENLLPLVGDARILWYDTAEDLRRFEALQERLKQNLANREYVREVAQKRCKEARRFCAYMNGSRKTSDIRKYAGSAIMALADAVAISQQEYYHFGLKRQFSDLQSRFPNAPKSIAASYQRVVEADTEEAIKEHAMKMFRAVCNYVGEDCTEVHGFEPQKAEQGPLNAAWLASLYQELCSTFQKVYVCCQTGDAILAFLSAVCLQRDLDDAREAGCPEYDLLGSFRHQTLDHFREEAKNVETALVQWILDNGGTLEQYEDFEQFEATDR